MPSCEGCEIACFSRFHILPACCDVIEGCETVVFSYFHIPAKTLRDVKTSRLAVLPSFSGVFFRKKDVEWQKNDDCPSFSVKKSAKKEGNLPHPAHLTSLPFLRGMGNPQNSLVSHPSQNPGM